MIHASRFFKPFFTVGNFIKHWSGFYFFGLMIIFMICLLIYNLWTNRKAKKDAEYHRLNACCIIVTIVSTIILSAIYGWQ